MTEPTFNIGDIVTIKSDGDPVGSDVPTTGEVVGYHPYGANPTGLLIVQIDRDVQGIYQPHELTLVV